MNVAERPEFKHSHCSVYACSERFNESPVLTREFYLLTANLIQIFLESDTTVIGDAKLHREREI